MLGRLDDTLEEMESNSYSNLNSSNQLPGPVRRMPLTQCIHEIVCEWSDGFLQMAKESDPAAQFLVAQMYLIPKGYGNIKYNEEVGIYWLLQAVETGDLEARAMARRLYPARLNEYLAKKRGGQKWEAELKKLQLEEKKMQEEEDKREHLLP